MKRWQSDRGIRLAYAMGCCAGLIPGLSLRVARAEPVIRRQLASVVASMPDAGARAGIIVLDLDTERTVFEHHADRALIPASAMKVFTMAAGVAELGAGFSFKTVLARDGEDLIVFGDGDPAFGDEKTMRFLGQNGEQAFSTWLAALKSAGIERITGEVILDVSRFDEVVLHPAWEPGDLGKWFAAPVGALNINGNCLDITLIPTIPGQPPRVRIRPDTRLPNIRNKCKTGQGRKPVLHHPPGTLDYVLSGHCTKKWVFGPVAFPDPGRLFADSLLTAMSASGINHEGDVVRRRVRLADGSLPPSVEVLAVHETPLSAVLLRIGKNSQNLFAEALFKRAGYAFARREGREASVGSWTSGTHAVGAMAARAGLTTEGLIVSDGSGLSRMNRCTARQLAGMLVWMHDQPDYAVVFDSLAVAGLDGSLRKRLKDLPGSVLGKTGTMRGVCALAGCVLDRAGNRRFAFAAIFNGYKGTATPFRDMQDRICRVLVRAAADADAN